MNTSYKDDLTWEQKDSLHEHVRYLEDRFIPRAILATIFLCALCFGGLLYYTVNSLHQELAAEQQARRELQTQIQEQQQEIKDLQDQLTLTPQQVERTKQEARQDEAMQSLSKSIDAAARVFLNP